MHRSHISQSSVTQKLPLPRRALAYAVWALLTACVAGCGVSPFSERYINNMEGEEPVASGDAGPDGVDAGSVDGGLLDGGAAGADMSIADLGPPVADMVAAADMVVLPMCSPATCGGCCVGNLAA